MHHILIEPMVSTPEIPDEDNATAIMYQVIGELPRANRDTLAFLMLHLQRFDLIYGLHRFSPRVYHHKYLMYGYPGGSMYIIVSGVLHLLDFTSFTLNHKTANTML